MGSVFENLIGGLIIAWILTCFDVDQIFIEIVQPFIKTELTTNHFYFIFACIGILYSLFK